MFCRNCGQQNDDRALFCVKCGKPLEKEMQQEQGNVRQTASRKSRVTLWLLIAVIVILLTVIGALGIFLVSAKKDETSADQSVWQPLDTHDMEKSPKEEPEEIEEEPVEDAEEAAEEMPPDEREREETAPERVSYATIEECSAICRGMSQLDDSRRGDEDLLSQMAFTALQMEYAKRGNGDSQKLYTKLRVEDESVLLTDIFNGIAFGSDMEEIADYHMWRSTDSGRLLKESAARQFVKDFYGNEHVDLSVSSCLEDRGDGYWSFCGADGDPWYEFVNYSVKENEDFYLLEGACAYEDNGGDKYLVGYAKYLFKKKADSRLGVTLVYSEFDHQESVNLAESAVASSELAPQGKKSYHASHLIDDNMNTCWVEGVSGTGVGETIELDLGQKQTVYGVIICNGYQESKYLYGINGKVTSVTVSTADGTEKRADLMTPQFDETKESFSAYERAELENWLTFDGPVYTDKIRITIDAAVAGSKYKDTCISEIRVY